METRPIKTNPKPVNYAQTNGKVGKGIKISKNKHKKEIEEARLAYSARKRPEVNRTEVNKRR